jgi:8-oxo-dGTP pyrophosphatase MutT (NUDIX family)
MRPAKPRDAASLVLWRPGPGGPEVLMGRRSSRHRFLPDMFVFPGGRLDLEDFGRVRGALRPDVAKRMALHVERRKAEALGAAAIRETEEETGLRLEHIGQLDYVARAITPPASPIRFHGRFFFADATKAEGSLGGSGELIDLAFRPIRASLELRVADITEFILGEIGRLLAAPDAKPAAIFWHYRNGKRIVSHD